MYSQNILAWTNRSSFSIIIYVHPCMIHTYIKVTLPDAFKIYLLLILTLLLHLIFIIKLLNI